MTDVPRYDNKRDYIRELVIIVTNRVHEILEIANRYPPDSAERCSLLAEIRPRYQELPDRWSYALRQAEEIDQLDVFSPLIVNLKEAYDELTGKFLTCIPASSDWMASRDKVFDAINILSHHLEAADSAHIKATTSLSPGMIRDVGSEKSSRAYESAKKAEWSRPLGLKKWAVIFGMHPNTMSEWFRNQNICNQQVSPRRWRVDISELPADLVKKARSSSNNK